jgi:Protein of unknown function (DUF3617)
MRTSALLSVLLVTSALAFAGGPGSPSQPPQQRSDKTTAPPRTVQGANYNPLNIKTGLWEVTFSRSANGELPMPAEYMSHLTPEQRARFEAAMKERSTHTYKSCVKKEDIDGSLLNSKNNNDCRVTILKSTSTELDGKMSCNMEGMRGDGTMKMHVLDSTHTQGVTHMTMTGNGKTFNTDATLSSKWIGSDCKSAD